MAPRIVERHDCDITMSFNRVVRQDLFRSGGGPHRAFLQKMMAQSGFWQRWWYRLSLYHRCVLAVEMRQLSAEGCRKIITVCQQGKAEMMEYYQVPEQRVVVIHNGVDHTRFHPARRQVEGRRIRAELGIPSNAQVVLFVGTGFKRKGLDRLLALWRRPEFAGIYLVVVGGDAKLNDYAKRGTDRTVLFVGPQPAVEAYYAAADLFVLPSTQEAFGNAVLEALASGLPVVTVPEVGATEKIEGELREGMLLNRDDPEEMKHKILRLLDPDKWPLLSASARRVAEKYCWDQYFSELEQQLYDVAAHNIPEGSLAGNSLA
jgi:UDP-glucose:(heptosyl)LPS alpha-1,3-glucosyltransferase